MSENELMEKIIKVSATYRDEGGSGISFVASSMFAIGSICGACGFPRQDVEDMVLEAINRGYARYTEDDCCQECEDGTCPELGKKP